jgi:hypothetical protein
LAIPLQAAYQKPLGFIRALPTLLLRLVEKIDELLIALSLCVQGVLLVGFGPLQRVVRHADQIVNGIGCASLTHAPRTHVTLLLNAPSNGILDSGAVGSHKR